MSAAPAASAAPRAAERRTADMRVAAEWVGEGARVLDLGCGRGVLLAHLARTRGADVVGVDLDPDKVVECVRRGVTAHQGDMLEFLRGFPDAAFDHVICSRTVEELHDPGAVLLEAARVGRSVLVGFVNGGYWRNRVAHLLGGRRVRNEVYPQPWWASRPHNPVTALDIGEFCGAHGLRIARRALLRGDWRTPCVVLPGLRAGYVVLEIRR